MKVTVGFKSVAANKLKYIPYDGDYGIFAAVVPTGDSVETIMSLADALGIKDVVNEEALHCTVMYSKTAINTVEAAAIKKASPSECSALVNAVESWVGHNDKTYITLQLVSKAIVRLHAAFTSSGAEATFVPYKAHITLSDSTPLDDEMKEKIANLNKKLAADPAYITLGELTYGNLEED